MQILQWLLKIAEQEASRIATPITKNTLQKRKKKTSESKVLPIAGLSGQSWSKNKLADSDKTTNKKKKKTTKAVSRMKELFKGAVNWKKGGSKQVDYDADAPKMRFRDDEIEKWINTIENWITTDSEFEHVQETELMGSDTVKKKITDDAKGRGSAADVASKQTREVNSISKGWGRAAAREIDYNSTIGVNK